MALKNGTPVHFGGLKVQPSDTREFKILWMILQALNNNAAISSGILNALGGTTSLYNTITNNDLLSAATLTIPANTIHSISFSVILGSASISFDGGSTSIIYPVGYNGNLEVTSTYGQDILIIVSGAASDGLNRLIVNTTGI